MKYQREPGRLAIIISVDCYKAIPNRFRCMTTSSRPVDCTIPDPGNTARPSFRPNANAKLVSAAERTPANRTNLRCRVLAAHCRSALGCSSHLSRRGLSSLHDTPTAAGGAGYLSLVSHIAGFPVSRPRGGKSRGKEGGRWAIATAGKNKNMKLSVPVIFGLKHSDRWRGVGVQC